MVKVHFFGTRSGTEPMEGMHHTSIGVETNGVYYFFDAGENCADSSHNSGVDLLRIKAVFISHTHMDHVGGLGGLFWNIRKLTRMSERRPIDKKINLFIPRMETWDGFMTVLKNTEEDFECDFEIIPALVKDGIVYEDENIKVTAFHNHHLQNDEGDGWISYSYRIETEGKTIVFSGDIRDMYDLDDVIGDGCDLLMVETGHHKVMTVGEYAATRNIGKLILTHHGREIINERQSAQEKVDAFGIPAAIAYDLMVEKV